MNKAESLTPTTLKIVKDKATEAPFSGEYESAQQPGTYLCRMCGLALFRAHHQFHSSCGWPSFDEEIENTVKRVADADGFRTEIVCSRCQAHLGHVFEGEGFTAKNVRHCVNSQSLEHIDNLEIKDTEEAIYAAGCFWGVEHLFKQLPGVLKTEVGYIGGHVKDVTYKQICNGDTGHYEALRVIFDPQQIDYEALTKYFFEIHHFAQTNGQGPDIGQQYQSVIFYYNDLQHQIAEKLIAYLAKTAIVATKLLPVSTFWRAEEYHQNYYAKTGKVPYCHVHEKKF